MSGKVPDTKPEETVVLKQDNKKPVIKKGRFSLLSDRQFAALTLFVFSAAFAALSVAFIYLKMPVMARAVGGPDILVKFGKAVSIGFGAFSALGIAGFAAASVTRYLANRPKESSSPAAKSSPKKP